MKTKVEREDGFYRVATTTDGYDWTVISVRFLTEQAARSVADAIERAVGVKPEPYRCTVLLEMPADNGVNTRPEEVVERLSEMGVEMLEWHDEDLIGQENYE
jgi:uncharacterized protein with GYD domain